MRIWICVYSRVKSTTVASQAFTRSAGESESCIPRIPALMCIFSRFMAEESMNVRSFFFMPRGEQPPRTYPVEERSSSGFIGVISLQPAAFLAFFRFISWSDDCKNTQSSFVSVRITIVLYTVAGSIPSFSAVRVAAPFASGCSPSSL